MVARNVRYCPCVKRNAASRPSGGASASTTASRVSRRTPVTVSEWKLAMLSEALEVVERLQAVLAAVLRLARRRAELADPAGARRPAARAADGGASPTKPAQGRGRAGALVGRDDAICRELPPPLVRDPGRRPGRGEAALQAHPVEAPRPQRVLDLERDHARGGAAGIG